MLAGNEPARAAEPGLDFIGYEQHIVLAAKLRRRAYVAFRRHDNAALTLDRFHDESGSLRCNRSLERRDIAVFDQPETRRKRPEPGFVLRFVRHRDDRDRTAVKVARAGNDLGLVVRDAFDGISPFSSCLYGCFYRLRTGVHRQRHVEPREFAGALEKRSEPVGVECPRDDIEFSDLLPDQADEPGMRVPMANRRVGAHHVEVFLAGIVPKVDAFATRQHHGQRVIIVCAVTRFEFDTFVHGTPRMLPAEAA